MEVISIEGLDGAGVVRLRVEAGDDRRCGFAGGALRSALEQAVVEAAPEVAKVEIEGLSSPTPPERLVTLGRAPLTPTLSPRRAGGEGERVP